MNAINRLRYHVSGAIERDKKKVAMHPTPWRIVGSSRLEGRNTYWAWDANDNPCCMTYDCTTLELIVRLVNDDWISRQRK